MLIVHSVDALGKKGKREAKKKNIFIAPVQN